MEFRQLGYTLLGVFPFKNSYMNFIKKSIIRLSFLILTFTLFHSSGFSQNLYWIGGSGVWDDPNNWSKNSGGSPVGGIPTEEFNAIFDDNSGLTSTSTVTVSPGEYATKSFLVMTSAPFTLLFDGSSSTQNVEMFIFGDLTLSANQTMSYTSNSVFHNVWKFEGNVVHNITTNGKDLMGVELLHANGEYNQMDNLEVSERIRHFGGEWNTNNHDVSSAFIYFRDNNSSNNALSKQLNAGTSDIFCDEWDSKLTYGSLIVTGTYTIHAKQFVGSPSQGNNFFNFHKIVLLELGDTPPGGTSVIEYNNFECKSCIVEDLVIEDTGITQLADKFTLNGLLHIKNFGSEIRFNGGNGRLDEVVLNCEFIFPEVVGCENERTKLTNAYNDFTTFIRDSGNLSIYDASLNNIVTSGNANFIAYNSVLFGISDGWDLLDIPSPLEYVWIGNANGTIADWNDPNKWEISTGGSNGCIPSIVDFVNINDAALGGIRIPAGFTAECRDFIWKNDAGLELKLDGQSGNESALVIGGNFEIDNSATITPVSSHEIYFNSSFDNTLAPNEVILPELTFFGNGSWTLLEDLNCDRFRFESGTFDTNNYGVTTDYWLTMEDYPKQFNFNNSHIIVNGEFRLAQLPSNNVTIDEGTSLFECEVFTSAVTNLHDLKLNNTSNWQLGNYPYSINNFILNTSNKVSTLNDLTVNNLIFNVDDSQFSISPSSDFSVAEGIQSNASLLNPAILKSTVNGVQADIIKTVGNLCATGYISIQDINSAVDKVFNAPQSTDSGNNTNINFINGSSTPGDLYWIGGSGDWNIESNWSRVSGGCPEAKHPDDAPSVNFDENSFFPGQSTVSINESHNCSSIYFTNPIIATLDINIGLSPSNIYVDGGGVTFEGKNMFVGQETNISGGGLIISELLLFRTQLLNNLSGLLIVRNGSNLQIK